MHTWAFRPRKYLSNDFCIVLVPEYIYIYIYIHVYMYRYIRSLATRLNCRLSQSSMFLAFSPTSLYVLSKNICSGLRCSSWRNLALNSAKNKKINGKQWKSHENHYDNHVKLEGTRQANDTSDKPSRFILRNRLSLYLWFWCHGWVGWGINVFASLFGILPGLWPNGVLDLQ